MYYTWGPIKARFLAPQHVLMHWKGEAANLLAGWLGGQRGLSHQSTAVLNENRKWFTSLMLQPSACLPAFALHSQFSRHSSYREWNWDQGNREKRRIANSCLKTAVMRCSHGFSVPASLTSSKPCIFLSVLLFAKFSMILCHLNKSQTE